MQNNLIIGPAISSKSDDPKDLLNMLNTVAEVQTDAIELSLTRPQKLRHPFTQEIFDSINKFKYKSIHAPVRNQDTGTIRYPSNEGDNLLNIIDSIITNINPNAFLFHPDIVDDFDYLAQRYPNILAFENMDSVKNFGNKIEDMEIVFDKAPNAKWVCDINHIYTNDKSMGSAKDYYSKFKNKLTHYHISSLGIFHDCFCITHEDVILKGLLSFDVPLIHEGNSVEKGVFKQEIEYVTKVLLGV